MLQVSRVEVECLEADQDLNADQNYVLRGRSETIVSGNPVKEIGDLCIDAVFVCISTPVPPACHPNQGVAQV